MSKPEFDSINRKLSSIIARHNNSALIGSDLEYAINVIMIIKKIHFSECDDSIPKIEFDVLKNRVEFCFNELEMNFPEYFI